MSNKIFALTVFCLMGLAFIWGALFQANYISQYHEQRAEILALRATNDSLAFEIDASLAHEVDFPEELPEYGDELCAYVKNDTIFVEHWHDYPHQKRYFRYRHGE